LDSGWLLIWSLEMESEVVRANCCSVRTC
jgi:hypothetical protein